MMQKATMKAAVTVRPHELDVIDVPIPEVGPDEVLIRVAYCGICATDFEIYNGQPCLTMNGRVKYPVRWGHEWSGRVCKVGGNVKDFVVGDRVLGDGKVTCGRCEKCLSGEWYNCIHKKSVGTVGDAWPGAMAEYMLMPARNTVKIGDHVSFAEAAAMEATSIAMNGLSDLPVSGSSVLIMGSGPIGLSAVQIARYMGAKTVIVAARKKIKLDIALKLGADHVINTIETDVYEEISRLTNGERANIVLETSGEAEYVENMTKLVALEGIFSIVGFYNRPISDLNMDDVVLSKLTLCGRCGSNECTMQLAQMLEDGTIDIKPIITHQIDFYQDIKRCMELYRMEKDTCVKMLVRIAGEDA